MAGPPTTANPANFFTNRLKIMNYLDFCKQLNVHPFLFPDNGQTFVVYVLMDQQTEIVYIGKSSTANFNGRLKSHRKSKQFSYYAIVEAYMTEEQALSAEAGLISLIRPKFNSKDAYPDAAKVFHGLALFNDKISRGGIAQPVYDRTLEEYEESEGIETTTATIEGKAKRFYIAANAVMYLALVVAIIGGGYMSYQVNIMLFDGFRPELLPVTWLVGLISSMPIVCGLILYVSLKTHYAMWKQQRRERKALALN